MTATERPLRAFELVEAVTRLLFGALQSGAEFKYEIKSHAAPAAPGAPSRPGGFTIEVTVDPAAAPDPAGAGS